MQPGSFTHETFSCMLKRHTEYVVAALFIKPKAKNNPLATGRQADKMVLRAKARIPTSSKWLTVE